MMPVRNEMLRLIAGDIVDNLKSMIKTMGITYTGQLENSFEAKPDGEDYVVGSRLVYAKMVEEGRLPGSMPPVNVLFPWVLLKIGGRNEEEVKRIAFAVAKKIEEKGIEPQRYIRATLHKMEAESQ